MRIRHFDDAGNAGSNFESGVDINCSSAILKNAATDGVQQQFLRSIILVIYFSQGLNCNSI